MTLSSLIRKEKQMENKWIKLSTPEVTKSTAK